eukprot:jgi/Tetstr1/424865/TSEL_015360.t1
MATVRGDSIEPRPPAGNPSNSGTQICPCCLVTKPVTSFPAEPTSPTPGGVRAGFCASCATLPAISDPGVGRSCSLCREAKPASGFHDVAPGGGGGGRMIQFYCRDCKAELSRKKCDKRQLRPLGDFPRDSSEDGGPDSRHHECDGADVASGRPKRRRIAAPADSAAAGASDWRTCSACGTTKMGSQFTDGVGEVASLCIACGPPSPATEAAPATPSRAPGPASQATPAASAEPLKTCSKCGAAKPSGGFYMGSSKRDRLSPSCRDCHAAYKRACATEQQAPGTAAHRASAAAASTRGGAPRAAPAAGGEAVKTCKMCEAAKPRSAFTKDAQNMDGLCARCRDCNKAARTGALVTAAPAVGAPGPAPRATPAAGGEKVKACSKCGEAKPRSGFHKDADGLHSRCRACDTASGRAGRNGPQDAAAAAPGPGPRTARRSEGQKECAACGVAKDRGCFGRDAGRRDGLRTRCKWCYDNRRSSCAGGGQAEKGQRRRDAAGAAGAAETSAQAAAPTGRDLNPPRTAGARPLKTCARCKAAKPRDAFHRDCSNKDGLQSSCKACRSIRGVRAATRVAACPQPPAASAPPAREGALKTCSRCHKAQPHGAFHRNSGSRDGLQAHCRACRASSRQGGNRAPAASPAPPPPDSALKTCSRCHKAQPPGAFYRDIAKGDGRQAFCRACKAKASRGRGRSATRPAAPSPSFADGGQRRHAAGTEPPRRVAADSGSCRLRQLQGRVDAAEEAEVAAEEEEEGPSEFNGALGSSGAARCARSGVPPGEPGPSREAPPAEAPAAAAAGVPAAAPPAEARPPRPSAASAEGKAAEAAAAAVRPLLTVDHSEATQQRLLRRLGAGACAVLLRDEGSLPAASRELVLLRVEALVEEALMS